METTVRFCHEINICCKSLTTNQHFGEGGRGFVKEYSLYAFINVDNFERPHTILCVITYYHFHKFSTGCFCCSLLVTIMIYSRCVCVLFCSLSTVYIYIVVVPQFMVHSDLGKVVREMVVELKRTAPILRPTIKSS